MNSISLAISRFKRWRLNRQCAAIQKELNLHWEDLVDDMAWCGWDIAKLEQGDVPRNGDAYMFEQYEQLRFTAKELKSLEHVLLNDFGRKLHSGGPNKVLRYRDGFFVQPIEDGFLAYISYAVA